MQVTHDASQEQKTPPPGARPGILPEPGPQGGDRSLRHPSGNCLPTLSLPVMVGTWREAVDSSVRFLVQRMLEVPRRRRRRRMCSRTPTPPSAFSRSWTPSAKRKNEEEKLPKSSSSSSWSVSGCRRVTWIFLGLIQRAGWHDSGYERSCIWTFSVRAPLCVALTSPQLVFLVKMLHA